MPAPEAAAESCIGDRFTSVVSHADDSPTIALGGERRRLEGRLEMRLEMRLEILQRRHLLNVANSRALVRERGPETIRQSRPGSAPLVGERPDLRGG